MSMSMSMSMSISMSMSMSMFMANVYVDVYVYVYVYVYVHVCVCVCVYVYVCVCVSVCVCVCVCVCERICPIRTPLSSPTDSPFQPCWILFSLSGEPRPASGSPCYDRGYNNRPAIPLLSAAFRRGNLPRAQINYNTHTHKIDCSLQNKTFFRMPPLD